MVIILKSKILKRVIAAAAPLLISYITKKLTNKKKVA